MYGFNTTGRNIEWSGPYTTSLGSQIWINASFSVPFTYKVAASTPYANKEGYPADVQFKVYLRFRGGPETYPVFTEFTSPYISLTYSNGSGMLSYQLPASLPQNEIDQWGTYCRRYGLYGTVYTYYAPEADLWHNPIDASIGNGNTYLTNEPYPTWAVKHVNRADINFQGLEGESPNTMTCGDSVDPCQSVLVTRFRVFERNADGTIGNNPTLHVPNHTDKLPITPYVFNQPWNRGT